MKMNQWKFNYKIENNFASEFFRYRDSSHIWGLAGKKERILLYSKVWFLIPSGPNSAWSGKETMIYGKTNPTLLHLYVKNKLENKLETVPEFA